jgi:hypothetical protein
MDKIHSVIPCEVKAFPCKYLGLPLNVRPPQRVDVQPMIDKVAARLPSWKAKFLEKHGQLTLVNSVLSSILVHFLTIFLIKK